MLHVMRREQPDLELTAFDNETLGNEADLAGTGAQFIRGDILDKELLRSAMKSADAVVHLAADTRVMDSIENPEKNFQVNVLGSWNVLTLARELGIERVVCASTGGAIMGNTPPPYDEKSVPRPISPYGASKLAMEGYCSAFSGAYGMRCVCLRFSNIYGPYSHRKESVVAKFIREVLEGRDLVVYGDGSQRRDLVFVEDIAQAIRTALENPSAQGVYQLGYGRSSSLNELLDILREVAGRDRQINVEYRGFRTGEVLDTTCRIDHARSELGYEPRIDLHEGVSRTWRWFLDSGVVSQPAVTGA